MIQIYNMDEVAVLPPGVIRCDRGSDWGNPFLMNARGKTRTRNEVCDLFELYAEWRLTVEPSWLDPLRGAAGLACWCVPKRCHVQMLVRLLERSRG